MPSSSSRVSAHGIAFEVVGRGEPLLLLHGTGGSRFHWRPVVERLSASRELLIADLPGHGDSAPPPPGVAHTPSAYAHLLADLLDDVTGGTAHVAGNSAGAWAALELAKLGRARSVVAIAPAGLWRTRDPWRCTITLASQYALGRLFAPITPRLFARPRLRERLLRDTVARPRQLAAEDARELARIYRRTPCFRAHLAATRRTRFAGGQAITVPVVVAWGEEERLIPRKARLTGELPPHARVVALEGCGHLAMWDDPDAVADLILHTGSTPAGGAGREVSA